MDNSVDEFGDILRPLWGSEQWILEGWELISAQERALIKQRMDELFKHGLPFQLKHDKFLYIYTFSLLAQLEVLAIQVPLKFESRMSTAAHRERMRLQLLDEIFHGLVFTKIVYLLSAPYSLPPAYNENIEVLCNFIRNQDCPKVAVVLLNLIAEGWIEELFNSLQRQGIAPAVFTTIINDEHRHVNEADLYAEIGLPDRETVHTKLAYLEDQLLNNIFVQYKYIASVIALLGLDGTIDFIRELDKKHCKQLEKLKLAPSQGWIFFIKTAHEIFPRILHYAALNQEIAMTPMRQVFMTQWNNPADPTMVGEFNLDVSCVDFFGKKFPKETITALMMQVISYTIKNNGCFRSFLSHNKLYQSKDTFVGLVVKLPDCGDHLGTIVIENCHELTVEQISVKIKTILHRMVYCYKKREQLERAHPHLRHLMDNALYEFVNSIYPYPLFGSSVVSLSNIGFCGYARAKSPLRSSESIKFTLLEIERKPVWNAATQTFEPKDILPVSISADHRIFDGNLPIPKLITEYFNQAFAQMLVDLTTTNKSITPKKDQPIPPFLEELLSNNIETGYRFLVILQTYWLDYLALENIALSLEKGMADAMS